MKPRDITVLREKAGLSREGLAKRMRVSVRTVESWEQGLRTPKGPTLMILEVLSREGKRGKEK